MDKVILYASPVFFVMIALELAWGYAKGRNTYRVADSITSLGQGVLSQVAGAFTRFWRVLIYTFLYTHVAVFSLDDKSWLVWVCALLGYDFCYYWHHRMAHEVNAFWATHVVHHSSEDFNLGTALRQPTLGFWWGWLFYVPLAVAGVPPIVFAGVALIDLLYQFWVHTEHVPKLGWFDRVFVSPSNHRVHHGVNEAYLDKNYGGILIIWDRLFGTFEDERIDEPAVFGTRAPLHTWNPASVVLRTYQDLFFDAWHAKSWADKLRIWVKHPGWRPADVAAAHPKPAFAMQTFTRFETQAQRATLIYCLAQFTLTALLGTYFLGVQKTLAFGPKFGLFCAIAAALWSVAALLENRRGAWVFEGVRWIITALGALYFVA